MTTTGSSRVLRAFARAAIALAVIGGLGSCELSGYGPAAIFQLIVTGSSGTSGTYVWNPTSVSGGAYKGTGSGGTSKDYIFNSFADGSVRDSLGSGAAQDWFLSTTTNHGTTALDSNFSFNVALPAASSGNWCTGVVTTVDHSKGGVIPATSPENSVVAGVTLTVGYRYSDLSGSPENTAAAQFQWQTSSSQPPTNASFTNIAGATSKTYVTSGANSGHYLRVKVTVVNERGNGGVASASQPVHVP